MLAKEVSNPPQLWKAYQALGELYENQGTIVQARSAYASVIEVIEGVANRVQNQKITQIVLAARPVQEIQNKVVSSQ